VLDPQSGGPEVIDQFVDVWRIIDAVDVFGEKM
jgi:hypothetical protein